MDFPSRPITYSREDFRVPAVVRSQDALSEKSLIETIAAAQFRPVKRSFLVEFRVELLAEVRVLDRFEHPVLHGSFDDSLERLCSKAHPAFSSRR